MNPILSQWLPVVVMVLAILFGLLYNNRGLDDFKDLMRSEIGRSESNIRKDLAELRGELKLDLAAFPA